MPEQPPRPKRRHQSPQNIKKQPTMKQRPPKKDQPNRQKNNKQKETIEKPETFFEYVKFYFKKFRIIKWTIFVVLLFGFIFEAYLIGVAKTTDVDNLQERLQETTMMKDQDGNDLGKLSGANGTYVSIDQISPAVQQAVVSTEDKRFYDHHGFDIIGIGRAMAGLLVNRQISGGGSTLTQQLVKNSFLTNEQTLLRKFKELFISFEVEKTYSKDQILEMYLNNSYFGNGAYGVQDASEKYFGKSAVDLTLSEGAVLAGALKGPSIYNPVDDYNSALERRNLVLQLMNNNGFIDENMTQMATNADMPQMNNKLPNEENPYQFYFDAVIDEARDKFGIAEEDLMHNGYQITTNLNTAYQDVLNRIYEDRTLFPSGPTGEVAQSASVVLDPYTGGVLAVVGGNGGHTFRGFNRATQMRRQPGSVIKPLNVYTPALEAGYTPFDIVPDEVKSYGAEKYAPQNHDYTTVGQLYLWQALAQSKNTTAVWLMNEIGVEPAMHKLDAFGIPYTDSDMALSSALGGFEKGTSPLEIAGAYTAFVNKGKRSEPFFIKSIVDSDGNEIVRDQASKQNNAVSPDIAETMSSMLMNVYQPGGTGASAAPYGYQIAGKTGTVETGENIPGVNDQWFVAYTPDIVVTSWYGFDQSSDENYIWNSSPVYSGTNFQQIMQGLLEQSPGKPFDVQNIQDNEANPEIDQNPAVEGEESSSVFDTINGWIDRGRNTVNRFIDQFR